MQRNVSPPLSTTFTVAYKTDGYIVTFLDHFDPNINIEIGNVIGSTIDMAGTVVETSRGTGYIDHAARWEW